MSSLHLVTPACTQAHACTQARHLIIICSGTRGDVHHHLALGLQLQAQGTRVTIATHEDFRGTVEQCGLPFAHIAHSPNELLARDDFKDALTLGHNLGTTFRFWREAQPVFAAMLASAWEICRTAQPEAILISLPTLWGYHLAEALKAQCIVAPMQPLTRTHQFPSVFMPFTHSLGGPLNQLTHRLVEYGLWWAWRGTINRFRRQVLGLPPLADLFTELYTRRVPFIYGYSPSVAPRPNDWPEHHTLTGYWHLPQATNWQPDPALIRFIDAPEPVVYMSASSEGWSHGQRVGGILLEAVKQASVRAIIPAHQLAGQAIPSTVFAVEEVPHAWLFPQMAAVAHHAGAGTTHTSLRAGVPTVTLPIAADQFFWAKRVAVLGAGPTPIPHRSLTAERLAHTLTEAMHNPVFRVNAQHLSQLLLEERGTMQGAEAVRRVIPS